MAKSKVVFVCQNCGTQSPKWMGKCASCGAWNSFQEEVIDSSVGKSTASVVASATKPMMLSGIKTDNVTRIKTGIQELDQVIGGGIVPGSVILLGGEPGIGKSTLLLQVAVRLQKKYSMFLARKALSKFICVLNGCKCRQILAIFIVKRMLQPLFRK
ncbi:MAG: AAA family ATPase [Bacteroidales bacterium]|nr:AAA family ATPase [Bacteroidales bacterium]